MPSQLKLLKGSDTRGRPRNPVLDPAVRARGLAGVAEARRVLEQTSPPQPAPIPELPDLPPLREAS